MFNLFKKENKRVYLDHAGSTAIGVKAKQALVEALSFYGNPSGIHKEGREAGQILDKARALCAKVLNAHSYEIYFTGTGTESCNISIMGTYDGYMKQGVRSTEQEGMHEIPNEERRTKNDLPHIVTTNIEHPAVLEPIRKLEREGKVRVTYIKVNEDGIVRVQDIREALTEDTILVSVMYANNEIGTLQPVKEIGRAIEEWKKENSRTHTDYPYFHTDACQAANYCNLDVVRLRAHLMTVNSSKVYGPKGVALLYKREGIKVESIVYGGDQERGLRSGTEAVAQAYSFAVALNEVEEIKEKESTRLRALRDYCKEELSKAIPDIKFYGAWEKTQDTRSRKQEEMLRLPNNINCRVSGISSEEMILRLDAVGFAVSHKSACASQETSGSYVVMSLGATEEEAMENIRITLGRSTSKDDIDNLVLAMTGISAKYT